MKLKIVLIVALTLGIGSAARAEVIVSLYTGTSHTRASNLRIEQPSTATDVEIGGVHWEPRPFEDAPYYGIRVGYFPDSAARLGGGIDFTHYKMYADTDRMVAVRGTWNGVPINQRDPMSARVQNLEISHGVNLTALNLNYRWPGERWQPYVGGGLTGYWPHAEGLINDTSVGGDYQFAGHGFQLLAGAQYGILKHVSLFAETKFDRGRLEIDLDPNVRVTTRTRTLHAIAGIAMHF
jgi:opacity protein-like surface antigen